MPRHVVNWSLKQKVPDQLQPGHPSCVSRRAEVECVRLSLKVRDDVWFLGTWSLDSQAPVIMGT